MICSANKHLISVCVQEACNAEVNQREVCVDGEEVETDAEVWDADLFLDV